MALSEETGFGDAFKCKARMSRINCEQSMLSGHYDLKCFDPFGNLKWEDCIDNIVVNEGLNHMLEVGLASGVQEEFWYVGLASGSPTPAAADTMASHGGWDELSTYDESTRPWWQYGAVASQSVDNSSNKAQYNMNTDSETVGGCLLVAHSTKGGTTGPLYSIGALTGGDKSVGSGDLLEITGTFSSADDGV